MSAAERLGRALDRLMLIVLYALALIALPMVPGWIARAVLTAAGAE